MNEQEFQYQIMDELKMQECYQDDDIEFQNWLSERERDNSAYERENIE